MSDNNVIEMQPVESSNVAEIGYDGESQRMHVRFHSGKKYEYLDVPPELFEEFANAESFGSFFAKRIRMHYVGHVVEMNLPGTPRTYGQVAYEAYGANRDWRAYNGEHMPAWQDLLSDIQAAWEAAANAARAV